MRALGIVTSLLLAVALLGAPGPAVAARASAYSGYESSAHQATNRERGDEGLRALSRSTCLQRFAERQARRMAAQGELFHQELQPIQSACGMGYVGENVAYGYPSGRAVVQGWMGSEGHRANILNRNYRQMALGAVKKDGRWWVAQVFGARS